MSADLFDLLARKRRRFIKAGYVWQYEASEWVSGHVIVREAGLIETLLYRWFGKEPSSNG